MVWFAEYIFLFVGCRDATLGAAAAMILYLEGIR
jgi:hypothetical protein